LAQKPQAFALEQNYPNPFNPTTVIRYQLPVASRVTLELFDVLGRKVATLVEAKQDAGFHEYVLNMSGFSSGMYFYRLKAADWSSTKKLMFLK
ncbi:MAG: T9SS type A sorting domain-containing protein, partial [Chloroherpetonaceae bacterium]